MEKEVVKDSCVAQPESYSAEELSKLRDFIDVLKKDEDRSALACWGNHHDYSHGY